MVVPLGHTADFAQGSASILEKDMPDAGSVQQAQGETNELRQIAENPFDDAKVDANLSENNEPGSK